MGFKLKALVAAVALAAVAGQASAGTLATPTSTSSDLLFFAIDASNHSFVEDLGLANAFLPTSSAANASQHWTTTSADWTSYLSAVGNDLSGTTWGVAYAIGTNGATSQVGMTVTSGLSAADLTYGVQSDYAAARTAISSTITALNATSITSTGVHYTNGTGNDNWNTLVFGSLGGLNVTADNAVGATGIEFFQTNSTIATAYAGQFSFDGTNLNYTIAAVPEPETYGMLAAGLLMLGAVARRRKA